MTPLPRTRANAAKIGAALVGLGALAGCTSGGTSSAAPTGGAAASAGHAAATPVVRSASALLRDAQAAVRSAGSVHAEFSVSTAGNSIIMSDDDTTDGGRQVMTVDKVGHATILFIAGVGYVQANALGLQGFFGVPQAQAEEFAGQWIALRPGNKLGTNTYADVTDGITLSSVAGELAPSGTPSLAAPTTIGGQRVLAVKAPLPSGAQAPAGALGVLYVTNDARLRPVQEDAVHAGSYKYQVSFSRWGEPVHLAAPSNSIPATDVTPTSTIT